MTAHTDREGTRARGAARVPEKGAAEGPPADSLALERALPASEAARRLLVLHYRTVLLNVEGAIRGEDAEPLHDLRIAIRRMRTVLRAFRKPLASTTASRVDRDLQRLNRILGTVRDLDVWLSSLSKDSVTDQFEGHRLWPKFVAHQRELRRVQQATVRRQLRGARFAALRRRVDRLLETELTSIAGGPPLDELAAGVVAKSLRQALKLGRLRHAQSLEKLHRLRIALRRVRYYAGFFSAVLGRNYHKLGRRAHALERVLGEVRDAGLALSRVADYGPPPPRLLVRELEQLRRADLANLERAWLRLADPNFLGVLRSDGKVSLKRRQVRKDQSSRPGPP